VTIPIQLTNKELADLVKIFIALGISLAFYAFYKYNAPKQGKYFRFLLKAIFIVSLVLFSLYFIGNLHPKEWDFTCFYMFGKVARFHLNFYNPDDYYKIVHLIHLPFNPSEEFKIELMNVGCLYPPPTVLMFLPLGYMSYYQALYFTYFLILLATLGCIYLLKEIFFKTFHREGWMLSVIIILIFPPLLSTIRYTQTLIFLLFLLLLVYHNRNKPWSGIFLAISIFVKPFTLIIILYFLLLKQWKTIGYFMVTCAVIGLISLLYFGINPFIEYLVSNPSKNLPAFWYSETTNQSLLAELYRLFPANWELAKKIYYVASAVILVISGFMYFGLMKRKAYTLLFPLLLALGLIIYPNGQVYYPIVHLLSLFIILAYIPNPIIKLTTAGLFYLVLAGNMIFINLFIYILLFLLLQKQLSNYFVNIPEINLNNTPLKQVK
jgi:hypothetical protein